MQIAKKVRLLEQKNTLFPKKTHFFPKEHTFFQKNTLFSKKTHFFPKKHTFSEKKHYFRHKNRSLFALFSRKASLCPKKAHFFREKHHFVQKKRTLFADSLFIKNHVFFGNFFKTCFFFFRIGLGFFEGSQFFPLLEWFFSAQKNAPAQRRRANQSPNITSSSFRSTSPAFRSSTTYGRTITAQIKAQINAQI